MIHLPAVTASMGEYLANRLGLSSKRSLELYKKYGTTLKGMLVEGLIDADQAEDFLVTSHRIDYEDITPDAPLASVLSELQRHTWVFTAGTSEHAQRCMSRLGLSDALALQSIIDVRTAKFESKHSELAFDAAFATARAVLPSLRPADCLLCDDSARNITRAKAMGWRTVLVGETERTGEPRTCDAADFIVPSLHSLPSVLPELFEPHSPAERVSGHHRSGSSELKTPEKKRPRHESPANDSDKTDSAGEEDHAGVPRRNSGSSEVEL